MLSPLALGQSHDALVASSRPSVRGEADDLKFPPAPYLVVLFVHEALEAATYDSVLIAIVALQGVEQSEPRQLAVEVTLVCSGYSVRCDYDHE
jgi:hypothetical protein